MNQFFAKNKTTIIVLVLILLAIMAYLFFFKKEPEPEGLVRTTNDGLPDGQTLGVEILNSLNRIQNLNLNRNVFSNPAFTNLRDFSRPVPSQSIGKDNPFDPIGQGSSEERRSQNNINMSNSDDDSSATSTQGTTQGTTQDETQGATNPLSGQTNNN